MFLIVFGSSRSGTTITMKILNEHSDIHLLNESRIFYNDFININPAEAYINKICNRIAGKRDYHRVPKGYKINSLKNKFLNTLKEDSIVNRAKALHKVMVPEFKHKIVGNKGGDPETIHKLMNSDFDLKVVYIHRDGRDVASSGVRYKKGLGAPWSNNSIENVEFWADRVNRFLTLKNDLPKEKFTIIKFEDYIDSPGKNMKKVEKLLGINGLVGLEKQKIDTKQAHYGYYTKWIPNWNTIFSDEVKNTLKSLGYI